MLSMIFAVIIGGSICLYAESIEDHERSISVKVLGILILLGLPLLPGFNIV